jgi:hypothetical protein
MGQLFAYRQLLAYQPRAGLLAAIPPYWSGTGAVSSGKTKSFERGIELVRKTLSLVQKRPATLLYLASPTREDSSTPHP